MVPNRRSMLHKAAQSDLSKGRNYLQCTKLTPEKAITQVAGVEMRG